MNSNDDRMALRIAILRAGRTQRSIADAVGIDPRVLSDYLLGRRNLPAETVARIHDTLARQE